MNLLPRSPIKYQIKKWPFFHWLKYAAPPPQNPQEESGALYWMAAVYIHAGTDSSIPSVMVHGMSSTWVYFFKCKCISVLKNHWAFFIFLYHFYANGFLTLLFLLTLLDTNRTRWFGLPSLKPQCNMSNDNTVLFQAEQYVPVATQWHRSSMVTEGVFLGITGESHRNS